MEKQTGIKKQRGFFDLGISLIVLAIGGTTAAVVTPDNDQTAVTQEQQVITTESAPAKLLIGYDIDS